MPKATMVCRVCGAKYEGCKTAIVKNTFRWQDVACSPECGAKYLRDIELSRKHVSVETKIMYNEDYEGFYETSNDSNEEDEAYLTGFGSEE